MSMYIVRKLCKIMFNVIVRELCTINYTEYVHCKRLEYVNRKVYTMRMYVVREFCAIN